MKEVLKTLILILPILILTACSSDDDGNIENIIDPLIGNWQYTAQFEIDTETTVTDCSPSTIEFTATGIRTDLYYDTDSSGSCIVVDTVIMDWEKLSDGTYQFTQNGYSFSDTLTFENGNNTLTFESSDADGNGNVVVRRFVYTRIN